MALSITKPWYLVQFIKLTLHAIYAGLINWMLRHTRYKCLPNGERVPSCTTMAHFCRMHSRLVKWYRRVLSHLESDGMFLATKTVYILILFKVIAEVRKKFFAVRF
jgi:DNA-binding transcriptional regulator YhcF (GntR family)